MVTVAGVFLVLWFDTCRFAVYIFYCHHTFSHRLGNRYCQHTGSTTHELKRCIEEAAFTCRFSFGGSSRRCVISSDLLGYRLVFACFSTVFTIRFAPSKDESYLRSACTLSIFAHIFTLVQTKNFQIILIAYPLGPLIQM